ncbi:hypothetical protein PPYR_15486 [Photinus pyralis]|uniref:Ferrochelatase n=1 Tax=Photinus pyralis TaxID=7054 RepID=A0A1Y1K4T1_PHOPY|nr:ferrochelatase, mitochondrial-like [Photinus pyralis]XP_031359046.1 ferrochelatase, mitochondrial-like [Photinus pyralis]KAB0790157.1 hypothetical protein PPYR_15522 [Photinus pyralis]KAB0790187.1 hypothetical protein PPYR_15486 [Photinus pyralis]
MISCTNKLLYVRSLLQIRKLHTKSAKTAVVMLNMGGPHSLDEVPSFLHKIMTDRDMIQFPIMQDRLGPWIAKRRTPEVQKKYAEIGGGSPIYKWTQKQGELLCKKLDTLSPSTAPHQYYIAFRYTTPSTEDAFSSLEKDGVERVIVFSQYPQYSCATSGSSFNEIFKLFKKRDFPKSLKFSVIDRWSAQPLLAKTFADLIIKELQKLPEDKRKEALILFSAHSLPLAAVNRGDSYPSEVGTTVQLVMQELNYCNPYQLVWQSKVGPLPWLGPFTDEALKGYVAQGKKTFLLVPIAFVNEHIETLHELDIEYCKDLAKEINNPTILRVPAPNDHPMFIEALANVVKSHLDSNRSVSEKFLNRCPHCVNINCLHSKQWYSKVCNI